MPRSENSGEAVVSSLLFYRHREHRAHREKSIIGWNRHTNFRNWHWSICVNLRSSAVPVWCSFVLIRGFKLSFPIINPPLSCKPVEKWVFAEFVCFWPGQWVKYGARLGVNVTRGNPWRWAPWTLRPWQISPTDFRMAELGKCMEHKVGSVPSSLLVVS